MEYSSSGSEDDEHDFGNETNSVSKDSFVTESDMSCKSSWYNQIFNNLNNNILILIDFYIFGWY